MRVRLRELRELIREIVLQEKGLWANIHAKRARGESPAKPGDKDYPDEKAWKAAQREADELTEVDKDKMSCNKPRYIRKGETGYGNKQKVVKACDDGKEKIVRFGDAKMKNRSNNPERRKNFRARHSCDQKKDKLKAGYWSCKDW